MWTWMDLDLLQQPGVYHKSDTRYSAYFSGQSSWNHDALQVEQSENKHVLTQTMFTLV